MFGWLRRSGALYGAMAALALIAVFFLVNRPAAVAGVDLGIVRQIAETQFAADIAWFVLKVAAFAAAFGALLGLWARWAGGTGLAGAAAFAVGLLALNARAMAKYPQLYAEHFHLKDGVLRSIQSAVTALPHPLWALLPIGVYSLIGLRKHPPRLPSRLLAIAALPLALQPGAAAPAPRPNILILAADSLRPDYLTAARTPNLADLAVKGTYWTQAYVHTPRTFPSWGELLSARFAPRIGIRHMFPAAEERRFANHSLVGTFKRAGYRTFVVADYAGDIFPRFAAGFDSVRAPMFDFPHIIHEQILRTQPWLFGALAWRPMRAVFPELREFADLADPAWITQDLAAELPAGSDGRPFFGVVFYSAAHFPYAVPFPDYKAEADPRYAGPYRYGKPPLVGEAEPASADVRQIRALFAGAVRAFDREVGEVRRQLALRGIDKNTIIAVVADHGENLYERPGDTGHGDHLAGSESLKIPFIVYDPTGALPPGRRTRLVQSVDVLPTLMEAAGFAPPAATDGFSVAATGAGRKAVFAESGMWFAATNQALLDKRRIPYPDILQLATVDAPHGNQVMLKPPARPLVITAKHQMAFDGRYKVLYVPTLDGVRWEGIDRQSDPNEAQPFAIPAPDAWPADAGDREPLRKLQTLLVEHALATGSRLSSAGWLLPGDGTWAP